MADKKRMDGVLIEGVDIVEVLNFLEKKKNKYLAIILNDLELILKDSRQEYSSTRKVILDTFNEYSRAISEVLFHDSLEK